MKSPRPWSYHQKAIAEAITTAISDLATRLRSSVRWATRDIVASALRARPRRRVVRRTSSLTRAVLVRDGSARTVGRSGVLRPGAELGRAGLGDARLLLELGGQIAGRGGGGRRCGGGGRRDDLALDRCRAGCLAGADVVFLH